MACVGAGGKQADTCGVKALHTLLSQTAAPGLTYENNAQPGAVTADVANAQLGTVQAGGGHLLVFIYVGGNDLAQYIFVSDDAAQATYDQRRPEILANWQAIFDYFGDSSRFPDGVTLIMNTQYNPFDDCTAAPYNLSSVKTGLLHEFNAELTRLADTQPFALLVDQYTPFLGHGHHHDAPQCPHYQSGAANWMADLIHANTLGHANFVAEWVKVTDRLYVLCN